MGYPVLDKPAPFERPRDEWSKDEAREVLAWLLARLEPRTDDLLERLGLTWHEPLDDLLRAVDARVPVLAGEGGFSSPSLGPQRVELRGHVIWQDFGPTLSASGEALGADLGFLIARCLQSRLGERARWVIGAHGRTYVSRNLPVLTGTGRVEFDPILVGLNVARGFVFGDRRSDLPSLFERWVADLGLAAPPPKR